MPKFQIGGNGTWDNHMQDIRFAFVIYKQRESTQGELDKEALCTGNWVELFAPGRPFDPEILKTIEPS